MIQDHVVGVDLGGISKIIYSKITGRAVGHGPSTGWDEDFGWTYDRLADTITTRHVTAVGEIESRWYRVHPAGWDWGLPPAHRHAWHGLDGGLYTGMQELLDEIMPYQPPTLRERLALTGTDPVVRKLIAAGWTIVNGRRVRPT